MKPWLVLPVKSIAQGKSRLAQHLTEASRRALNGDLLAGTLAIASRYPGLQRTIVVSACSAVLQRASDAGARCLREAGAGPGELNAAIEQAVAHARDIADDDVLIVASDLPFARHDDLRALVDCSRDCQGLALAPDRAGSGTNALCLPRGTSFRFRYGPGSRLRHCEEASHRGLTFRALRLQSLAFDVDTIDDYRVWQRLTSIRSATHPTPSV